MLVEGRDPARLARALEALWCDDALHAQLRDAAVAAQARRPTWPDVAKQTRAAYAAVARIGTSVAVG